MRDKFAESMPYDQAQAKAARIYNAKHPGAPVTRASHEEDIPEEAAHRAKHAGDKMKKRRNRRMPPPRSR
jgi:hypothetical protein